MAGVRLLLRDQGHLRGLFGEAAESADRHLRVVSAAFRTSLQQIVYAVCPCRTILRPCFAVPSPSSSPLEEPSSTCARWGTCRAPGWCGRSLPGAIGRRASPL